MSLDYLRTCRLCAETAWAHDMVKYGTRCYAHIECFVDRKTMRDFEQLPAYEQRKIREWKRPKP